MFSEIDVISDAKPHSRAIDPARARHHGAVLTEAPHVEISYKIPQLFLTLPAGLCLENIFYAGLKFASR
ncbi:hypothetical protein [Methyloversatilis discipulorum]|uniref:hypothetical protein n=1 Tax=Methyloversatilis discipulorum TaxID=1119528 RepID=UPI001A4A13C5|nr:hypothetical protein [Methyloversatilis discipulorum]MBL8469396.1 hypothetical protein [Methyloversatilis discipulorum]